MYRRSDSFGQVEVPDEYGYYPNDITEDTICSDGAHMVRNS